MVNKNGQVAIWVIIAVVLSAAIVLFFTLEKRLPSGEVVEFQVEEYIKDCVTLAVQEAEDKILPVGGFANSGNFKIWNDTNISYLCLHTGYFKPCINQHPMLINEISREIEDYIEPKLNDCLDSIRDEINNRGGSFEIGSGAFNVSMAPGMTFVNIKREARIAVKGETRTFDGFYVEVASPAYDLARVAMDITMNEAKYCAFLTNGYMILYPRWDIRITMMSDFTKIYSIKDKDSGKKMNIAIRSCAMPPGMGV